MGRIVFARKASLNLGLGLFFLKVKSKKKIGVQRGDQKEIYSVSRER